MGLFRAASRSASAARWCPAPPEVERIKRDGLCMPAEMSPVLHRNQHNIGLPLVKRNPAPASFADVKLPRACNLLLRVEDVLLPVSEPPCCPGNSEEYREEIEWESHRFVNQA